MPAQTKVSGKLTCGKPDVNSSAEVPDAAGHLVMLSKATSTWPTPLDIGGGKTKSAIDVATAEVHGATGTQHGRRLHSTGARGEEGAGESVAR